MSHDIIAFDLSKCERCSRSVRSEAEKLIRSADKLSRATADTATWWVGGSRNGYMSRANELDSLMRKAAEIVLEMSENLIESAEYKKAEEDNFKIELLKLV